MEPDHFKSRFSMEQRYRLLVDAVQDYAIYVLDTEGHVASWNSGAQRLKGYSESEVLGHHFSLFYTPEDRATGLPNRALATAALEGRYAAEGWRVRKDGTLFWAQVSLQPIRAASDGDLLGFAKITRDLTERRAAEEALRRTEEQFRLLVNGVVDYAIFMLDPDGRVTNWNAGAQRIKGYAPAEIIGSHFSRFYLPEDAARGEPARALATAASKGRFESEGWRQRQDGSRFWANVVIDAITDPSGQLLGFAKVTRDVTEKRAAQQALERAREELFQSQKLDALGQLTGGLAHDFNNLLMVILSSLELIRRRLPDDERLTRLLDNAVKGARRGVSLTDRMLSFARRQELKPGAVDLAVLVSGMRDMLERLLGTSIAIETVFPPGLSPVLVDPNQLELALLNLAVNARDAMPDGGRLVIEASDPPAETLPDSGQVCLSVKDSGFGMDADTLARATEPFFTTKGPGKGTGLGLSMVHGLAAQSGGRFELTSRPGSGTTGWLWLPRAASDAPRADAASRAPVEETSVRPLVAVAVDDDSLVLSGTVSMLEDLGHTVIPAASAEQALAAVRSDPRVSVVITDHVMPGMKGADLAAALRAERPDIAVVLATGFAELPPDVDPQLGRLAKPFGQDALARAIAAALRLRQRERVGPAD